MIFAPERLETIRRLPKVDLHRHLEGSLRLETLLELSREFELSIPRDVRLERLVQVQDDEPNNMVNFLSKFKYLRSFYRSPQIIQRLAREVIEDAALDGVVYLELMFTPAALCSARGFSSGEVMDWMIDSAEQARRDLGIGVQLIVSVNRHEPLELAESVLEEALRRRGRGIVALNLAGNEVEFSALPFASLFECASAGGLAVTIHAGEWGGASNVRQAIEELNANRIGHGIRVMEDPDVVRLARQNNVAFEVCVTSNVQTGVTSLAQHPLLSMLEAGLRVTLNTDDPGISNITLSQEFLTAAEDLGLSSAALHTCSLNAVDAAFLPVEEKTALKQRFFASPPHFK